MLTHLRRHKRIALENDLEYLRRVAGRRDLEMDVWRYPAVRVRPRLDGVERPGALRVRPEKQLEARISIVADRLDPVVTLAVRLVDVERRATDRRAGSAMALKASFVVVMPPP